MDSEKLLKKYIATINARILPKIDYGLLQQSYATEEKQYAKDVLKQMHDAFVTVYGTDYLDNDYNEDYEFVTVPAIIKGRNTGEICIGLVDLDLSSSGEHWGTAFITEHGILQQGEKDLTPEQGEFMSSNYMPYNYWYTVDIERDHHVDFDEIPPDVQELYDYCQDTGQSNSMDMNM